MRCPCTHRADGTSAVVDTRETIIEVGCKHRLKFTPGGGMGNAHCLADPCSRSSSESRTFFFSSSCFMQQGQ